MGEKKLTLYFSNPGEADTEETLRAAKERAEQLGIRDIVVASTRGSTGLRAMEIFQGYNMVVVPHVTGMREPGTQEMPEDIMEKIKEAGGRVVVAAHTFSGVNRAIQSKFDTVYPAGIMAQTLRLFGQGMKVVVEITAMAADAGVIPIDRDVVAIAGTGKGADTAVVVKPSYSHSIFDMVVREIIAKPRNP
ncbi:MAG: pyruvate kinase alpha/beta domain-containing protein [Candidatus Bathyarchaeia archaeon]